MEIERLAEEHKNDFPGYQLVDFYHAAFPSFWLQFQVLMQEQRSLPLVEEFILRTIETGQQNIGEIAGLLGLEWKIVLVGLEALQRRGQVKFGQINNTEKYTPIFITPKGQETLTKLFFSEPKPDTLPVCLDALTGKFYPNRNLLQIGRVREFEYHEIPTYIPVPTVENLNFIALKRLVQEAEREDQERKLKRELIEIREIEKNWTGYRVMQILQFVRSEDGALQVQVYDGVERSTEHETVLLEMERAKYRPLRAIMRDDVPPSYDETKSVIPEKTLVVVRRKAVELPKLEKLIESKFQRLENEKAKMNSQLVEERQDASLIVEKLKEEIERYRQYKELYDASTEGTEVLEMQQHRPKLMEALRKAEREIIIISPWMNEQSMDYELREEIKKALKRGVNISIGHGFGDADYREEKSLRQLRKIAKGHNGKLWVFRIGDVHSKVLICDEKFMIMTSFNWLSFKGDPVRGSRVEDGILTRDPRAIRKKKAEWVDRFKNAERSIVPGE